MPSDNTIIASSTAGTSGLPVATSFGSGSRVLLVDPTVTTEDASGTCEAMDPVNLLKGALNEMSTTQGAIITRSSSAYTALAPGASGFALGSQGSGADLIYLPPRKPIFSVTAAGSNISNTTTPTSIFTGATIGLGSLTIPANRLAPGSAIGMCVWGDFDCTTGTPTLTATVTIGGVTVLTGACAGMASAVTGKQWKFDAFYLGVQATGATGKIAGDGHMTGISTSSGALFSAYLTTGGSGNASTQATIDTTGALAIDITMAWSAASTSNRIRLLGGSAWIDG